MAKSVTAREVVTCTQIVTEIEEEKTGKEIEAGTRIGRGLRGTAIETKIDIEIRKETGTETENERGRRIEIGRDDHPSHQVESRKALRKKRRKKRR